jgi:hypothetical protein
MKSQSNELPLRIQDLGDGRSHFNYNIIESETEANGLIFTYDQVFIQNPVTREKKIIALVKEKYSIDHEMSILRQRETKAAEFTAYFEYVESCKLIANA